MSQEFVSLFRLETKRLLWLIGVIFAVILAFQYIELPYGNFLLFPFSTSKIPAVERSSFQTADPTSKSQISDNVTILNPPTSNDGHALNMANETRTSEEKHTDPNLGIALEPGRASNKSLGSDESDKSSIVDGIKKLDNGSVTEVGEDHGQNSYDNNLGMNNLTSSSGQKNITLASEHISGSSNADSAFPSPAIAPTYQIQAITPPPKVNTNLTTAGPELPNGSNVPSVWKDNITSSTKNESLRPSRKDVNIVSQNSSLAGVPSVLKDNKTSSMEHESVGPSRNDVNTMPIPDVLSISEMNKLLLQSRASYGSMRPRWSFAVDHELLQARLEIENAPIVKNDPNLYAPIYRNVSMFKRSYDIMEERLKVYVYREGERPIMHSPFLRGIYASEGWFMKLIEANKRFVTKDPKKAHLFFLPFSSRMLEETLYIQGSHSHKNLKQYLNNYVDMIATKHPFWNRTGGSDHFLVACHDWAPGETEEKMARCIRALCNADVKEGFVFGKDVSLPETYIRNFQNPTKDMGGKPASKKSTLAFFAGNMHGYVRPILLQHWEDKDPDMKIFGKMPKSKGDRNYIQYMKSSKYCICAKGYEVNSPRVVEAILYECVPVIISDNFVPPFFEVLNWESFAVFVMEKDIPYLKDILLSIPAKRYLQMQMRVRKVQQHFLWHAKPVKYDIFHMILHSIWYNRVFNAVSG